ncbi:hypothetical protein JTE90_003538 [Oedothorax gibbosus]|uniref:Uncharacterized protein n=1 Tax=Oedothorax gibbosus TaxID=931172 RepID=A0AAV6UP84_9ARAC|nr:hypothetical protein JTE90_003538 [Oedothorax gibbosus]
MMIQKLSPGSKFPDMLLAMFSHDYVETLAPIPDSCICPNISFLTEISILRSEILENRSVPTHLRITEANAHSIPPAVLLKQLHQPVRLRVPQRQFQEQFQDSAGLSAVPEATEGPGGTGAKPDRDHLAELRKVHLHRMMAERNGGHETRGQVHHGHADT